MYGVYASSEIFLNSTIVFNELNLKKIILKEVPLGFKIIHAQTRCYLNRDLKYK